MKTTVNMVAASALTAAVTGLAITAFCAGPIKNPDGNRGRQGVTQASEKGAGNSSMWSADPERGWVRADERRKAQEQTRPSSGGKTKNKKPK